MIAYFFTVNLCFVKKLGSTISHPVILGVEHAQSELLKNEITKLRTKNLNHML